jgi:hypothetical protein
VPRNHHMVRSNHRIAPRNPYIISKNKQIFCTKKNHIVRRNHNVVPKKSSNCTEK